MRILLDVGLRTRTMTVAVALGLCLVANGDDALDPNNGYGPNDRPVHAFISVIGSFEAPIIDVVDQQLRNRADALGSQMIRLKVGTFIAGPDIPTTRFLPDGPVPFDPALLPLEPGPGHEPANFEGSCVTVVGAFKTLEPDSTIHLFTPYSNTISASVQEAYFNASVFFDDGELSFSPTTVEVALFIYDHQGNAGASINAILQEIFHVAAAAPVVLEAPKPPVVTAEGDLVPHTPGERSFGFDLDLDPENGILDADVCLIVGIDVKPGNSSNVINVKSDSGVVWIAVLSSDSFDALTELDPDTVVAVLIGTDGEVVNEVAADRDDIKDVNGDGLDDYIFKFSVTALVDGPNAPLTTTSTTITFRGVTLDGMGVQGSDNVTVIPKSK